MVSQVTGLAALAGQVMLWAAFALAGLQALASELALASEPVGRTWCAELERQNQQAHAWWEALLQHTVLVGLAGLALQAVSTCGVRTAGAAG